MARKRLTICNEFGETPTTSYTAAGVDFKIPHLATKTQEQIDIAYKEFEKSFGLNSAQIDELKVETRKILIEKIGDAVVAEQNIPDVVHLYLSLDAPMTRNRHNTMIEKLQCFCEHRLVYDKETNAVGMKVDFGDHIKINSGIREALPEEYAGIFMNKSGMGSRGFDVRACVVDEDYTGMVHLSMSYTKDKMSDPIYAGDKIVQQLIIPVWSVEFVEEIGKEAYDVIMKDSQRGANGFGSTDNKHGDK